MRPIPTIQQINEQIQNDLRQRLSLSDDDMRKVFSAVSAVLSGQIKLVYLYLADIQRNLFPDSADAVEDGGELERLGMIYLNRNRRPATDGYYKVRLNGVAGSTTRVGLTFKSNDDALNAGKLFIADASYELTGLNDELQIRSLESGLSAALAVGNQLTITEPVLGVEGTVEVLEIIELPVETESVDVYRQAIIDAIQLEPQGGARTDYRLWAADVQGVRTVYTYVKENEAGVVQVFVEATPDNSEDGHGTPSSFMIDDVLESINLDPDETLDDNDRGRKPIQAILEVLPITLKPVDVEIIGLSQNNISVQSLIRSNLESYLYGIRPFVAGTDLPRKKNDILNAGRLNGVVSDSLSNSNYFMDFKMFVDGQEESVFTFSFSNIPYLRNVVYS